MNQETLYLMALTRLPHLSISNQHKLLEMAGSATAIFEHRRDIRDIYPEAPQPLRESIAGMDTHLDHCVQEAEWAESKKIQCIACTDAAYPQRLKACEDSPLMLYYRGTADLNSQHIISMVGTRKISDYGKQFCDRFLRELSEIDPHIIIFSGLAYGIDVHSHRAALSHGMDTIGVLAHGLDKIYPATHRSTAAEMVSHGGLLTEYMSHTDINKSNFVARNRIVAGCSDATIVVESAAKGGSLITADMAMEYGREVLAVPGRLYDKVSEGCNNLIASNSATLLTSARQLVSIMGWDKDLKVRKQLSAGVQQDIFPQLSPEQQLLIDTLRQKEKASINTLAVELSMTVSQVNNLLFDLELNGMVRKLPGNVYTTF